MAIKKDTDVRERILSKAELGENIIASLVEYARKRELNFLLLHSQDRIKEVIEILEEKFQITAAPEEIMSVALELAHLGKAKVVPAVGGEFGFLFEQPEAQPNGEKQLDKEKQPSE